MPDPNTNHCAPGPRTRGAQQLLATFPLLQEVLKGAPHLPATLQDAHHLPDAPLVFADRAGAVLIRHEAPKIPVRATGPEHAAIERFLAPFLAPPKHPCQIAPYKAAILRTEDEVRIQLNCLRHDRTGDKGPSILWTIDAKGPGFALILVPARPFDLPALQPVQILDDRFLDLIEALPYERSCDHDVLTPRDVRDAGLVPEDPRPLVLANDNTIPSWLPLVFLAPGLRPALKVSHPSHRFSIDPALHGLRQRMPRSRSLPSPPYDWMRLIPQGPTFDLSSIVTCRLAWPKLLFHPQIGDPLLPVPAPATIATILASKDDNPDPLPQHHIPINRLFLDELRQIPELPETFFVLPDGRDWRIHIEPPDLLGALEQTLTLQPALCPLLERPYLKVEPRSILERIKAGAKDVVQWEARLMSRGSIKPPAFDAKIVRFTTREPYPHARMAAPSELSHP